MNHTNQPNIRKIGGRAMIERDDGSFGDIIESEPLLRELLRDGIPNDVKSIHFGALEQLIEIIKKKQEEQKRAKIIDDMIKKEQYIP